MRIFVDANILFTAAYSPKGKAAGLLESASMLVITSDYAIDEARRNLLAKRPAALDFLEMLLKQIEIVPSVQGESCPIALPSKDQPIFLAALKAKATHLITGDLRDFGPHMNKPEKTSGVLIQTLAEFLDAQ